MSGLFWPRGGLLKGHFPGSIIVEGCRKILRFSRAQQKTSSEFRWCKWCLTDYVKYFSNGLLNSSLDPIDTINDWATRTIDRLLQAGFKQGDIIIDPGIGFGKSAYQSRHLIHCAERIKQHGCQVLVGHSRKSFMTSFCTLEPYHRDLETVAVSSFLHTQGIDFLRVHDVQQHQRFFVANHAMCGGVRV